jgi:hypothetical protein
MRPAIRLTLAAGRPYMDSKRRSPLFSGEAMEVQMAEPVHQNLAGLRVLDITQYIAGPT